MCGTEFRWLSNRLRCLALIDIVIALLQVFLKDLQRLLPMRDDMAVVVDDRLDVCVNCTTSICWDV